MRNLFDGLKEVWKYIQDKPDVVQAIGAIAALLFTITGVAWTFVKWGLPRVLRWQQCPTPSKSLADAFPFEVIMPYGERQDVLKRLLGSLQANDDALADFNIAYVSRDRRRNVSQELESSLRTKKGLLILGRTGLGKTREAAELAQRLNQEGWTILRLKDGKWLDVPVMFPEGHMEQRRKLLFFLDDLNRPMYSSRQREGVSRNGISDEILKEPLQERLQRTLAFYERECREVWVVATARNELVPEREGEPSERDKLELTKYLRFWRRFEQYVLPESQWQAFVTVLKEGVKDGSIKADSRDFDEIARRNDGTFRNIVENLIQAKTRQEQLSIQTFRPTLLGSWKERYDLAVRQYPVTKSLYDAVDLLRQVDVELQPVLVQKTALLLRKGHWWQAWETRRGFRRLVAMETRLLDPPDGLIEAKEYRVEAGEYLSKLSKLLLQEAKRQPLVMVKPLSGFAFSTYRLSCYREALPCLTRLLGILEPSLGLRNESAQRSELAQIFWMRGNCFSYLGEDNKLGNYQDLAQKNFENAITSYDKAVEIKPDYYEAWYNRGGALSELDQLENAITSYDKAVEIKPNFHEAWYNRGNALSGLDQLENAITSYDRAIEIKLDKYEAYCSRGNALFKLDQLENAIISYDKAIEIKPADSNAFYNKACCFAVQANLKSALENLRKALDLSPDEYQELAKTDTDFDSIRNELSFQALLNPQ